MKSFERVWSQGKFSRQAHRDLPEGTFEHETGRDGFAGPATHLYHPRPPTSWSSITGPLRPRAFDLNASEPINSPFDVPILLQSDHIQVAFWVFAQDMNSLVKNADGDTLLFVHHGNPSLFCDYGQLSLDTGDYVVIPRGTTWRVETESTCLLLLFSTLKQSIQMPDRGLLGRHALWDPSILDIPELNEEFKSQQDKPWSTIVKKNQQLSTVSYTHNPLNAVGWKGDHVPVRLNVSQLLPINSHRYHLPPSVHATFQCESALISTFVPRPFETDETAIKIPFFHSNHDVDEVLFYHSGDFFSRDNIDSGFLTLHPSGIVHGPHPKSLNAMYQQKHSHTNEIAVMLDVSESLSVCENAAYMSQIELSDYADSWRLPDA